MALAIVTTPDVGSGDLINISRNCLASAAVLFSIRRAFQAQAVVSGLAIIANVYGARPTYRHVMAMPQSPSSRSFSTIAAS